ncbi:hypothetical protein [Paracoccus mutanolyticus]|uniref:hypothetical protein n=1 Tax=Paracoccus mutanolyticus TaxID=1499308 RepID=UPI00167BB3A8|nr:hypothetical protein [Paracoccus mutanolyticus]
MLKTLALTGCLGLALAAPLAAETYTDPDRAWWTGFLDAVDGRAPDLEALARQDLDYLASDELTRDAVLAGSCRLQSPRAAAPATAEVVLSTGGAWVFPGYSPPAAMPRRRRWPGAAGPANWKDAPWSRQQGGGRALRQRIGMREILAQVTVTEIRKSATRRLGYEGRVTGISYYTQDGSLLRRVSPPEAAPVDAAAAEGNLDALRGRILSDARIPALGTRWEEAAPALTADWPVIASDVFCPSRDAAEAPWLAARAERQRAWSRSSPSMRLSPEVSAISAPEGRMMRRLVGSWTSPPKRRRRALGPGWRESPGVPDGCAGLVYILGLMLRSIPRTLGDFLREPARRRRVAQSAHRATARPAQSHWPRQPIRQRGHPRRRPRAPSRQPRRADLCAGAGTASGSRN